MSKITLMAGTPKSLCRAWHALYELERSRGAQCRAPGCPIKITRTSKTQRDTDKDI